MSIVPEKLLPSLPGYRPKENKQNFNRQKYFKVVDGGMFIAPPEARELPYIDNNMNNADERLSGSSLFQDTLSSSPTSKNTNMLTFYATCDEIQDQNTIVSKPCAIYYYMNNKTLKVTERPQINNGVSQPTIIKRSLLLKDDGSNYEIEDFYVGDYIYILDKSYKIIDADDATRKYLIKLEALYSGDGNNNNNNSNTSSPEKSAADWGKFHSKKNQNKSFNEACLGNTVNNTKREGFLKYGDGTLKFQCLCQNTNKLTESSPASSIQAEPFQLFTLVYHLCDDTIEIFAVPDAKYSNPFTRLLKRSPLPKNPISVSSLVGLKDDEYFHWTDFHIGKEITVFSRLLHFIDCDVFTRSFYQQKGYELAASIPVPEQIKTKFIREIPPPTFFGSDEDSLRSCVGSLRPSAPRAKVFDEEVKLSYFASLLSGDPDLDGNRKFIINYYVTNKTIQILEPPIKNSGFVGGIFLSRREIKDHPGGEFMLPKDFIIGNSTQILKHLFLLEGASDSTIQWMENKKLPQSNIQDILNKILPFIGISITNGELLQEFEQVATTMTTNEQQQQGGGVGNGRNNTLTVVTKDHFKNILSKYCPTSYWSPDDELHSHETVLNTHELLTITRAFTIGSEFVSYLDFIYDVRELL